MRPARARLVLGVLLALMTGLTGLVPVSSATGATRTFVHPQSSDSGAPYLQTRRLVVRNTTKTLHVTAHGTYRPRRIDRVDLVFSTWGYARCWDLRSTQPHRLRTQDHVLYSLHCGNFRTVRCPGARIYADPGRRFFRFSVPQSCLGRPAMVRGSVSFEDTSRNRFTQSDFTFVLRG